MGLTGLGSRAGLHARAGLHNLHICKLLRQILNPLQIKCVQNLEGEQNLVQLHLPVHPFENPRPTSHSQIRVLVSQVRPLNRHVAVVPEIEAVNCLVSISFLLRLVFDQNADSRRYPQPFLKISGVYLQLHSDHGGILANVNLIQ
ncbi:hypothetical protein ACFX2C_045493 [Malus domestica]